MYPLQMPVLQAYLKYHRRPYRISCEADARVRMNQMHPAKLINRVLRLEPNLTDPFAINRHLSSRIDAQMLYFGDILDVLHISRVTTSSEDNRDLRFRVHIM